MKNIIKLTCLAVGTAFLTASVPAAFSGAAASDCCVALAPCCAPVPDCCVAAEECCAVAAPCCAPAVDCCAVAPLADAGKTDATAKAYPLTTCAVSGEKLGEMGDPYVFTHEGQEIKLCCKSCKKKFDKSPETYLKKLKDAPATK